MGAQCIGTGTVTNVASNTHRSVTNLAARYRPEGFSTLTGQRHVAAVLRPALVSGEVPQQLLFSGGSGLGKTTVARIVASAVLCHTSMALRDQGDPCGTCVSCEAMRLDRHPDYVEFDAASHGGKEEVREIAARAQTSPLLSGHRVYVIDEAHGLSAAGGQAFLKLLEEPPEHVMFMLCTTDPERMLQTNRGRCTEFELRRPPRPELLANLRRVCTAEGWEVPDSVLETVLDCSDLDLGVRGTVNTLQKIAQLLSSGNTDLSDVIAVLGLAPATAMEELLTAIGNGQGSLQALMSIRQVASDDAIRAGLLRWLRDEISRPMRLPDSSTAADLLEMLLRSPSEPAWLDLIVVRAAERAHRSGVSQPLSSFAPDSPARKLIHDQPAGSPKQDDLNRGRVARGVSVQVTAGEPPHSTKTAENTSDTRITDKQLPVAPVDTPKHGTDDRAAAFVSAVARMEPNLGSALKSCSVEVGSAVVISTPEEVRPVIEAGMKQLRLAAGRAGLAVELR
jgi:DNA polymerase III subunit gamma/tau